MTEPSTDRLDDRQRELLARIEAIELDHAGASLPFSARLARDNGWSPDFANRVVAEYRRFVFLAAVAGHPVTPSDEVDQAWHLHLVYTRSYWDELCGEVLGFPLHHGPTVGGPAEGRKFDDWYTRTLDSYRRLFGVEPPADIWPPSVERFADADRFRRVNTADHWVVPKPSLDGVGGRRLTTPVVGGLAALTLTGCLAASASNPALLATTSGPSTEESVFAWVGLAVALILIGAIFIGLGRLLRRVGGKGRDRAATGSAGAAGWWGGGSGCGGGADTGCGSSGCGGGGCGGGGCGA